MASRYRIPADEWSGTEIITSEWQYNTTRKLPPTIFRFVNGLDASVDITAHVSDSYDENGDRRKQLQFYDQPEYMGNPIYRQPSDIGTSSITVSAGETQSYTIRERWDRVYIDVAPASQPGSGSMDILELE
jgi:hypothetical protein